MDSDSGLKGLSPLGAGASNSEIRLPLPPRVLGSQACASTAWLPKDLLEVTS